MERERMTIFTSTVLVLKLDFWQKTVNHAEYNVLGKNIIFRSPNMVEPDHLYVLN